MKERKRMWRTEKHDCFIWSVHPGFHQPWQMMVVSTLIVGQVICGLDKPPGTEYASLYDIEQLWQHSCRELL